MCDIDVDLARVVERFGPPPLWARRPGFATLVRIVIEQQVSLASANAMFGRLKAAVDPVTPEGVRKLQAKGLRELGLTRQKARYCHDIAQRTVTGELDFGKIAAADDQDARRLLLAVCGIGPWSADIYRLMALRRPDVWPDGDLALVEAARRLKRLRARPSTERLREMARSWAPWRAVAARILWHFYLSAPR